MLLEVLRKIRYMNDTEFNMLCGLLGLTDAQNQVNSVPVSQVNNVPMNNVSASGVTSVQVTAKPSVMYPVNGQVNNVPASGAHVAAGGQNQHQKKATWHNLPIVNDPNWETEKSYAHVFMVNNVPHILFIARTNARVYNNILKYGIMEESFYTIYRIDDYQNKQKTQLQPIDGKNLAAMLGV